MSFDFYFASDFESSFETSPLYIYAEEKLHALNYKKYVTHIREALAAGVAEIVLDFSCVKFIDTYGLSLLIKGYKLCHSAGVRFKVANVCNEAVTMIFRVTNIERLVPVEYRLAVDTEKR